MATLVHFNITAANPAKIGQFYHELFDWKIEALPGQIEPYYMISTEDLKHNKGIGGGIATGKPGIINYVGVSSIENTLKKVLALGGKIIQAKQAVPGFGFLAVCADPEENMIGLFEEDVRSN